MTSTAHLVFLVIALALIFEVVGIFTSSVFFWVLFIFFYISFVLVFIIQVITSSLFNKQQSHIISLKCQIYHNWSGPDIKTRIAQVMQNVKSLAQCDGGNAIKDFFHPAHFFGSALVLVVSTLLFFILKVVTNQLCQVNIAMAFWFFYKRSPGVSRYILAIMMVNMVLYISNYICCKLYYR